jgi:diaminopropionate ammonia-lyase
MQGYTAIAGEALRDLPQTPTHVFLQAGVGGFAAAIAGHMTIALGDSRPLFVVVEPERAACLYASARAGQPVKIEHGEPTVMAMLECYKPSLVAWRVLTRVADAWMTVSEDDAVAVMNRLARPKRDDPALVAGESGGAGLAGLLRVVDDRQARKTIGLDGQARVLIISTEGATDPARYAELVGLSPADVVAHPTNAV